jgi:branched-subunit amino acid transport protein
LTPFGREGDDSASGSIYLPAMPNRALTILLAVAAAALVLTALLGSSGKTDGDPSTSQQIANVTMPIFVLATAAAIVVGVIGVVRRR